MHVCVIIAIILGFILFFVLCNIYLRHFIGTTFTAQQTHGALRSMHFLNVFNFSLNFHFSLSLSLSLPCSLSLSIWVFVFVRVRLRFHRIPSWWNDCIDDYLLIGRCPINRTSAVQFIHQLTATLATDMCVCVCAHINNDLFAQIFSLIIQHIFVVSFSILYRSALFFFSIFIITKVT